MDNKIIRIYGISEDYTVEEQGLMSEQEFERYKEITAKLSLQQRLILRDMLLEEKAVQGHIGSLDKEENLIKIIDYLSQQNQELSDMNIDLLSILEE